MVLQRNEKKQLKKHFFFEFETEYLANNLTDFGL